eukprot:1352747-Pleurochrysis_carterae.AAC.1
MSTTRFAPQVVLSSYGTLVSEWAQVTASLSREAAAGVCASAEEADKQTARVGKLSGRKRSAAASSGDGVGARAGGVSAARARGVGRGLFSVVWRRVVLDEAHAIKSHVSQTARA